MTQADANTIAFTFTMPESAGDGGGDKHGNGTVASRTMRVRGAVVKPDSPSPSLL